MELNSSINSSKQALGLSREIINSSRLEAEAIVGASKREAEDIISKSKAEAARIISEARGIQDEWLQRTEQEVLKIKKEAREDGFQKGLQEVMKLFAEFNIEKKNILNQLRKQAIEMTLDISKQIVGDVITCNSKEILSEKINDAFALLNAQKDIALSVSKSDFDLIKQRFNAVSAAEKNINLCVDDALKDGSFEIEVGQCKVLANIHSQLDAVIMRIKEQAL